MQFSLPSNLQQAILAYDPALKKLAQENKPKSKSSKPKYPLGDVPMFVPEGLVTAEGWQNMVDLINQMDAPNRFHTLGHEITTHPLTGLQLDEPFQLTTFILYHFESVWYAAWLPPEQDKGKYIYGYAYAYKNTDATRNRLSHRIKSNEDIKYINGPRTEFGYYNHCVTVADLKSNPSKNKAYLWKPEYYQHWSKKTRNLSPQIDRFEQSLKLTIPTWEDSRGFFDRISATCIYDTINFSYTSAHIEKEYLHIDNTETWIPNADSIYKIILASAHSSQIYTEVKHCNSIIHIITKPFFRKWIQAKLDEMMLIFNDPTNSRQINIQSRWNIIWKLFESIRYVHNIWPDTPIDYYQNHIDALLGTWLNAYPSANSATRDWLYEHMPVASFFKLIQTHYDKCIQEIQGETTASYRRRYSFNEDVNIYIFTFDQWTDTISMLNNLNNYKGKIQLDPPRRWRISEFHDHVQSEAWKISNPNVDLPQDLFPQPIKVNGYSFFQPHDTHQLSQWGQAVRNCVGNASHYAEGVRKKKHFIVLAMYEGKPRFTIQLDVNHGVMSVKQIVGLSNQRLSTEEQAEYTEAFRQALTERDNQLQSA